MDGRRPSNVTPAGKLCFIVMPGRGPGATGRGGASAGRRRGDQRQIPSDRNVGGFWWKRVSSGERRGTQLIYCRALPVTNSVLDRRVTSDA